MLYIRMPSISSASIDFLTSIESSVRVIQINLGIAKDRDSGAVDILLVA